MAGAVKGAVALATFTAVWLTTNLGEAWWVLLGLLALDGALNWRAEDAYLRKLGAQLVSIAAVVIVQQGTGLPAVHALVVGLVAWELTRVVDELNTVLSAAKAAGKVDGAQAAGIAAMIAEVSSKLEGIAARIPAGAPVEPASGSGGGARAPGDSHVA